MPVLVYHGTADELIPVAVARQLVACWRRLGVEVDWRPLPLLGHVGAGTAGGPVAVPWLAARFAQDPD